MWEDEDYRVHRWPCSLEQSQAIYEFNAQGILELEDRELAKSMIFDLQAKIENLERDFKMPLVLFMKHNSDLIDAKLGKQYRKCRDGDYKKRPDLLVYDLLNFVHYLAGGERNYVCPIRTYNGRCFHDLDKIIY